MRRFNTNQTIHLRIPQQTSLYQRQNHKIPHYTIHRTQKTRIYKIVIINSPHYPPHSPPHLAPPQANSTENYNQ
jgi:hypothetical protein